MGENNGNMSLMEILKRAEEEADTREIDCLENYFYNSYIINY